MKVKYARLVSVALALALVLSLVPMVASPRPVHAASIAFAANDMLVEIGSSPNQVGVQRALAGPSRTPSPFIVVNVGDVITFKSALGTVYAKDVLTLNTTVATGVSTGVSTANSGVRTLTTIDTYPTAAGGIVAGDGDFNPGGAISVSLGGSPLTTIPANATVGLGATGDAGRGEFIVSVKVPEIARKSASAPAVLKFSDAATEINVNVVVNPKALFTPDKGAKGKAITVTGQGFRGSSSIDVEIRDMASTGTAASGTGTLTGTPVTLTAQPFAASQTLTTTATGTFTITMPAGTTGLATSGTATVTGSPVSLAVGANTIATTTTGTIIINMYTKSLMVSAGTLTTDANGSVSGSFAGAELMSGATPANQINVRDGGAAYANAWELATNLRAYTMDPSAILTPSSGAAGSVITVEGSEFPAASTVGPAAGTLTIGGIDCRPTAVQTADANGKFTAFQITIPRTLTAGKKSVVFTAGGFSASTSFTVTATPLTLSPTKGPKGQEVVVTVKNMAPTSTIAANAAGFVIGGVAVTTHNGLTTDSSGNGSVTITIPTTLVAIGAQDVIATIGGTTATGSYDLIKPTLKLTPSEQVRTGTVSVTGTGWVNNKNVTINVFAPGAATATTTVNALPGADGAISASFTVSTDLGADSNNNAIAMDTQGNTADTVVLRVPAALITVTPAKVKWGETITITGKGFKGGINMRYGLPWAGVAAAATFPTATYSDSAGNFTATLVVPTVSRGIRSLGITDDGTNTASFNLEVEEAAATAASALAPISTQLVRVWALDAATQTWKMYDPAAPALSDLTSLDKGKGYWVKISAATSIVTGSGNSVSLVVGWNLIGW